MKKSKRREWQSRPNAIWFVENGQEIRVPQECIEDIKFHAVYDFKEKIKNTFQNLWRD
jgi:hypothetical protein